MSKHLEFNPTTNAFVLVDDIPGLRVPTLTVNTAAPTTPPPGEGDLFLHSETWAVSRYIGGSWLVVGVLKRGVGIAGPVGDPGPVGPQGEIGPVGPQGEIGLVGPQGVQGEIGPIGPQGEIGPVGPQGVQGEIGPVGPQGEIGPVGSQGIQGEVGLMGLQGIQGEVGPIGAGVSVIYPFRWGDDSYFAV
ncbi:MAG: collagen-like protein, partial [Magnetococcales bacterium]|nr:collagen-like protein [Magnetococcales bacterium]